MILRIKDVATHTYLSGFWFFFFFFPSLFFSSPRDRIFIKFLVLDGFGVSRTFSTLSFRKSSTGFCCHIRDWKSSKESKKCLAKLKVGSFFIIMWLEYT